MANADTYEQADASTEKRPGHTYKIIVNGRPKTVESDRLSFEEVVALAFDPVPSGPNVAITVTYRHAAQRPDQGMLIEGQSVKIKNGTVFNVTATDKS